MPAPDRRDEPDAPALDLATLAIALLVVDPVGLGGVMLRARHGPARAAWLARLRLALPAELPLLRVPLGIADDRLLGGLDLTATLAAGRPIAQRGLLAQGDGGVLLLAMAERLSAGTVARLVAVLDQGELRVERDGLASCWPARLALVALDEGAADDEATADALADRLAFHLDEASLAVAQASPADADSALSGRAEWLAARQRLPQVTQGDDSISALCRSALALGVRSLRAPLLALRAARALAALSGDATVNSAHTALAAQLVLAPRATCWPPAADAAAPAEADADAAAAADHSPSADPAPPPASAPAANAPTTLEPNADTAPAATTEPAAPPDAGSAATPAAALDDQVLAAALSALPPDLLARLRAGQAPRGRAGAGGRAGALQAGLQRGRPVGSRRGPLGHGARLDLVATLRAAAPWQRLRRRDSPDTAPRRVQLRPDDLHTLRHVQRRETTAVFLVDASGSAALHRLAEAKGAVEQLLADCYVRRDRVALVVFRGHAAELVLPPTRSLVRAKRALAGQPGGGGTPLASALDAGAALAAAVSRRGGTPLLVLLTDGRANICRDGRPGRTEAAADALASARRLRCAGISALLVDTSPATGPLRATAAAPAQLLASALAALYLPLPLTDPSRLSQAVQTAARALR